jgi:hypothetical protein
MNCKGFFTFILVFVMILFLFELSIIFNENDFVLNEVETDLIALEQANKERTIIENNVDKILSSKLREQLLKENFNVLVAQNEINLSLLNYLYSRASKSNLFLEEIGSLDLSYLNQNSVVVLLQVNGISYGEYVLSSNELKTNNISRLLGDKIRIQYKLPIEYVVRVMQ